MKQLFTNNAIATLLSGINDSVTSLSIASGLGALFPVITGTDFFLVTLMDGPPATKMEIIKVTARAGDSFGTVVRNFEACAGFSGPYAFDAGDIVELRLTSSMLTKIDSNHLVSDIAQGFNHAYTTGYSELTLADGDAGYTDGDLKNIDVWTNSGKTIKLYSKTLTYTSGDLTRVDTVDEINSLTLRKDLVYSSGDLTNITTSWV